MNLWRVVCLLFAVSVLAVALAHRSAASSAPASTDPFAPDAPPFISVYGIGRRDGTAEHAAMVAARANEPFRVTTQPRAVAIEAFRATCQEDDNGWWCQPLDTERPSVLLRWGNGPGPQAIAVVQGLTTATWEAAPPPAPSPLPEPVRPRLWLPVVQS
jgi:hypothetical protein